MFGSASCFISGNEEPPSYWMIGPLNPACRMALTKDGSWVAIRPE